MQTLSDLKEAIFASSTATKKTTLESEEVGEKHHEGLEKSHEGLEKQHEWTEKPHEWKDKPHEWAEKQHEKPQEWTEKPHEWKDKPHEWTQKPHEGIEKSHEWTHEGIEKPHGGVEHVEKKLDELHLGEPPHTVSHQGIKEEVIMQSKPIIEETITVPVVEEVQPVIERERIETEYRYVEQPIHERQERPIEVQERILPMEEHIQRCSREEAEKRVKEEAAKMQSTVTYAGGAKSTIVKEPIILETVRKEVIEQVQPVIHREVIEPVVVHTTLPIREVIEEEPKVVIEHRPTIEKEELEFSVPPIPLIFNESAAQGGKE